MSDDARIPRSLATALVATQFVLLAALAALTVVAVLPGSPLGPGWWPRTPVVIGIAGVLVVAGVAIAVAGVLALGRTLTASPIPLPHGELVTRGAYRRVRHPIYTGLLLGAAGLVVLGAGIPHAAVFVALLALLMVKSRLEERMLRARFPGYAEYAARTGRLVPGLGRVR